MVSKRQSSMKFPVEAIFTFSNHGQGIVRFKIDDSGLTEKKFLYILFSAFEDSDLDLLADLAKISCCQQVKTGDQLFPFLAERNGKFYFNPEINDDPDTKDLRKLLDEYLINRKNKN